MAKFKITAGVFTLMAAGKKTLKVKKAEGKPSANPKEIEVTFKDAAGATLKNKYTLDEKNETGSYVTSLFLSACLGNIDEFDTNDIPQLVGKYVEVEVVHNEVESKKDPSKTNTFANIGKIYGAGEPFGEHVESNRPKL